MSQQATPFKLATTCQTPIMAVYQAKIKQQKYFLELIRATLFAPLAEHVLYCVISGKKCLLYTDAEEWATQLRFYQPILLDTLANSTQIAIHSIQVRLISPPPQQTIRNNKLPSKENIKLIQDNLQYRQEDELKQALLRLSQTLERLS
jgi:hypothetical protein